MDEAGRVSCSWWCCISEVGGPGPQCLEARRLSAAARLPACRALLFWGCSDRQRGVVVTPRNGIPGSLDGCIGQWLRLYKYGPWVLVFQVQR